ncbi:hypothetical protein [Methanosarcina mazei]|uniref:Glycosyltransferase RgtA/B/C/D-like domain-containing protein n=1 Tax=Methanosarcina mazei TaxID=2209 RepID=A0A6C0VET9_METMZ|nr:hypothetical protein [Methanosarcina mazei]QIB89735.1 hypothetical protein FQU78_00630 [Methanosarcina mazei]
MTNREFSKINSTLKFINQTIYLYPFFIGMVILYLSYYSGIGQYGMGFAFVLGSVLFYVLKEKFNTEIPNRINLYPKNNKLFLILNSIFLISFSLSLIELHYSIYVRPTLYFILVTISFFSIFVEIFHIKSNNFNYLSLLKIICVSLSFRLGRFFNYPSIPGSDIHFHLNIAKLIVHNGAVPNYSVATQYSYSCLLHIFEAINIILLTGNLRNIVFYSIVLSSTIITSLLVYCIIKKIYNVQIALIAVLFINIADMLFVQNVTNINPSSIVYCFFLVILFCIIQQINKPMFSLIVVVMILCMVLSHQLSTFCVFLIIFTLLLSILFYNSYFSEALKINLSSKNLKLHLYSNTLVYFFALMIFYWSQMQLTIGNSFFEKTIYRLNRTIISIINEYSTDASAPTSQYESLFSTYDFYSNLLYNLGSNFLLMLAIVGILLVLGFKYKSLFSFSCMCATFMLFGLIYAGTYVGLGYLLIPHRLLSFLQLFLVFFASFSTYYIYAITSEKWTKFGIMVIVILLIFFMITTPYINRGDTIYATNVVYRDQYTYSELKSLEWSNYFLENHTVFVDLLITSRPLSTVDFLNVSAIQIVPFKPKSHEVSKNILIRQYIMKNSNLKMSGTFGTIHEKNYQDLLSKVTQEYNLIYSNNYANVYQK